MLNKILTILFILVALPIAVFCEEAKWEEQSSSHFIVYFKEAPEDFIDEVIETAENCYRDITQELGFLRDKYWIWEERAKIYIYSDADDYRNSTEKAAWVSGHADYEKKIIYTYPLAWGFFDTLLPHELGHIIFREFVGQRNVNVPLWLDEGVACYQEQTRRWGAEKKVREAIEQKKFMPLDELTQINSLSAFDDQKVNLFYDESVSIVSFLITKYGRYNFVELCRALRDGKSLDKAVDSAYARFESLKELNDVWYRYLNEK